MLLPALCEGGAEPLGKASLPRADRRGNLRLGVGRQRTAARTERPQLLKEVMVDGRVMEWDGLNLRYWWSGHRSEEHA